MSVDRTEVVYLITKTYKEKENSLVKFDVIFLDKNAVSQCYGIIKSNFLQYMIMPSPKS